jgi:hypothetical protein
VKPARRYHPRITTPVSMRELEAGDRPRDIQGRELPFAPGDLYVQFPFYSYVLSRELVDTLYVEESDGNAGDEHADR